MKKVLLILAVPLVIAPAAEARSIKPAKAKALLKAELAKANNEIAAEVKKQEPNAHARHQPGERLQDEAQGRNPRVDYDLAFTFRDQQGTDVTCELRLKVKYKSRKSKKLTADLASSKVDCNSPDDVAALR